MSTTDPLAENVFLQKHPLNLVGCQMGRAVTVLRLSSGKLLIHSTADFSPGDVAVIREFGEPGWLFEATNFHDTLAQRGRAAFPDIPYLVPTGFKKADALGASPIQVRSAPDEWGGQLDVIAIRGMPKIREHALYHRSSKTLIVADLIFNLPPSVSRWTRSFMRVAAGFGEYPGMSRMFRFFIKDRDAFCRSLQEIAALDFERVIVAHGDPLETDAKPQFLAALSRKGFDVS